jgi:phosphohistidine phosphatase
MDCLLIRHGIALDPMEWDGLEAHRPLTDKGEKHVRRAAAGLVSMGLAPTHLLSSPFTRALDTAKLIHEILCPSLHIQVLDELAVGSTPERLLAVLRTCASESVVLCVGHEPLLAHIAGILVCGKVVTGLAFKKAGAALIHLPHAVAPGQGLLGWWLQPAQLRALRHGRGDGKRQKVT